MPRAQEFVGSEKVVLFPGGHGRREAPAAPLEISTFLRIQIIALVAVVMLSASPSAHAAKLAIVATTTDLASLAQAVGGAHVEVTALVPPQRDAESYEPRPRDLEKLRDAQLVLRVGLDYDPWLDRLLKDSANSALQRGGAGYVDASRDIALLETRAQALTPMPGHAHGAGNPHYWLDPTNAVAITGNVLEALARLDPPHARDYEAQRLRFLVTLETKTADWRRRLAPFAGRPMIAYHDSWPYFARRFRLNVVEFIEVKPGVPPSPRHLAGLLRAMREQHIGVIVKEPFEPVQAPAMLAGRTGAHIATLTTSVGSLPGSNDYLALLEYNVAALEAAFGRTR